MDFVGILKLGFVGIGFLLAALAFQLLRAEQKKDQPRSTMLTPIYIFMVFALALAGAALFLQLKEVPRAVADAVAPYRAKLNKLDGLIDAKALIELQSCNPTAEDMAKKLVEEMDAAKSAGLI